MQVEKERGRKLIYIKKGQIMVLKSVKMELGDYHDLREIKLMLDRRKGISVPHYVLLGMLVKAYKKNLEKHNEEERL